MDVIDAILYELSISELLELISHISEIIKIRLMEDAQ